ncbi:GTP pyrophosphokinase family protein [Streptomyces sp. NPDC007088]|uniref:GTP pyrophosphokinase n=1 Tax=Streptomyces sp. NPDC007088 TaxID=3364773 RepID=UPI0036AC531A
MSTFAIRPGFPSGCPYADSAESINRGVRMQEKANDYEEFAEPLRSYAPALESLMRELLLSRGIQIHYVRSRVKAKASTIRKLEDPAKNYTGISDLTDMLGVRIVTYFPDDVDRVADVIEREFEIDEENSIDKRALLDPDRFGYLSLHFIARLKSPRIELAEYTRFKEFVFEVQVRSILQHAWAEIEHDLGYKSSSALPPEIKRRFSRVAGMLEVADDEFQAIRDDLAAHQRKIDRAAGKNWEGIALDEASIYSLMSRDEGMRSVDRAIAHGLSRSLTRPERSYAASRLAEIRALGFDTVPEVRSAVLERREEITAFAVAWISDENTAKLWAKGTDIVSAEVSEQPYGVDAEFTALPIGVGLFYYWLLMCASGEVIDPPYHEEAVRSLSRVYRRLSEVSD